MQTESTVYILWFWKKNIFKSDTFKKNLMLFFLCFAFVLFFYFFFLFFFYVFFLVRLGEFYCLWICLFVLFYFCHVSNVWKSIKYMINYYIMIFQISLIWPRNSDQDNLFNATVVSFAKDTFTITRKPDWLHCAKYNT